MTDHLFLDRSVPNRPLNQSQVISRFRSPASEFGIEVSEDFFVPNRPEGEIQEIWDQIQTESSRKGRKLWDGTYYRLDNLSEVASGARRLVLKQIRYSTVRALIAVRKKKELETHNFPFQVNTGALIRTSDDFLIFARVPSGPELVGGGLQSSELSVQSGKDLERNVLKEMTEEINVPADQVEACESLGFLFSGHTMGIVQVFEIKLSLSSAEVEEHFNQRTNSELLGIEKVPNSELNSFLGQQQDYLRLVAELL